MPRRQKDTTDMTDTTTDPAVEATADAVAGGPTDAATNGESAAKRSTVDDLPLGPMKTRTGADATVIQGPQGKRVFTAGGDKGGKIKELLTTRKDLTRKQIAELVGCSQSRVAEVARVLGLAAARPKTEAAAEGEPAAAEAPATEVANTPAAPESVST